MREIKFRAWDKIVREMLYPVWEKDPRGTEVYLYRSIEYPNNTSSLSWVIAKDAFIPLQYTGLHDKNGKEIFEGDIVASSDRGVGKVRFTCCEFVLSSKHFDDNLYSVDNGCLEIIGNVYENPNLLKGE
jgi:uncharacterized phage protein (TIGR01671 family)